MINFTKIKSASDVMKLISDIKFAMLSTNYIMISDTIQGLF